MRLHVEFLGEHLAAEVALERFQPLVYRLNVLSEVALLREGSRTKDALIGPFSAVSSIVVVKLGEA